MANRKVQDKTALKEAILSFRELLGLFVRAPVSLVVASLH